MKLIVFIDLKQRELIVSTLGASTKCKDPRSEVNPIQVLDAIIVDYLDVPPHSLAPPARLCAHLKRVDESKLSIPLIDVSWIAQCIINQKRLAFDSDPRHVVDVVAKDAAMQSMKINEVRYDVGDYVEIKKLTLRSFARIQGTKPNANQRPGCRLDVRCLVSMPKHVL